MTINTPHPKVLRRVVDLDADERIDLIAYSELVKSMVNIGTYIFEWEVTDNSRDQEDLGQIVIVSIFRRLLDLFDSCSTLLKVGSVASSNGLIRVALELTVELEYLLLDTNTIERKAKAYILMGHDGSLKNWGKIRDAKNYPQLHNEADVAIQEFTTKIKDTFFEDLRNNYEGAIYNKDKKRKSTMVKWYSLIDKEITSVFSLMDYLEKNKVKTNYVLYSVLSNYIHSSDLINDGFYDDENNKTRIRPIRVTNGYQYSVNGLTEIGLKIYRTMIRRRTVDQQQEYDKAIQYFHLQYKHLYQ